MYSKNRRVINYSKQILLITSVSLCVSFVSTKASIAGPLDNLVKYAEPDGGMSNVTKPRAVSDQQTGYYSGGSIVMRGPRPKVLRPAHVQLPDFKYDPCTGSADMLFGGFSFLRSSAYLKYMKDVANGVPSYLAMMAIKEISPQIQDILSQLEATARDINGLTMNRCKASQSLATGIWNVTNNAMHQRCMAGNHVGRNDPDLYKITERCDDDPSSTSEQGADNELKSMLGDEFNLVWKALSQGDGAPEKGLKELMMSISGSVISQKDHDGTIALISLPSLVEKDDLIEKYIGNSTGADTEVKLYRCTESTKCLNPEEITKLFRSDETMYGKINTLLESITVKVADAPGDNPAGTLNDEESALIEFSEIPLIRIIEAGIASGNSQASILNNPEFVEVICYDVITNFMQKLLRDAKSSVEMLKRAQIDDTPMQQFSQNVEVVRSYIKDKRYSAYQKLAVITQVKQQLQQQERVFELGFTQFMESRGD